MPGLILANLLICERVLTETDNVMSAIRIVDLFYCPPASPQHAVPMVVLASGKFAPNDQGEHTAQLKLIRPNGAITDVADPIPFSLSNIEKRAEGAPGGFNVVAQLGIIAEQVGLHYFVLLIDGEQVAKSPFTLSPSAAKAD